MIPDFFADAVTDPDGRITLVCKSQGQERHYTVEADGDDIFNLLSRQVVSDFPHVPEKVLMDELRMARPCADSLQQETDKTPQQGSMKMRVLSLLDEVELFSTRGAGEGEAFATIPTDTGPITVKVSSSAFKGWLTKTCYQRFRKPPGKAALEEAIDTASAKACFEGERHEVHIRIGHHDGHIFLDLADGAGSVVKVGTNGWEVIAPDECPTKFLRANGMLPLPIPERGGSLENLRELLNIRDQQSWVLFVSWLLGAFRCSGPYTMLIVTGEQGTGKTVLCHIARKLLDPSALPLRALPRSEQDLMIAAKNSRVLAFDNLSHISPAQSDTLCMVLSGGGHACRQLYTNHEEAQINVARPVLANGIGEVGNRPDLVDRALLVYLDQIDPRMRVEETKIWTAFEHQYPELLGALLDAVATALAREDEVALTRLPRMADFARWVTAAEPALGWDDGEFIRAYEQNREMAATVSLEANPLALALAEYMRRRTLPWKGTAQELLNLLKDFAAREHHEDTRDWPRSPRGASDSLRRAAPVLRAQGVEVTFQGAQGHNNRRIITARLLPDALSDNEGEANHTQNAGSSTDPAAADGANAIDAIDAIDDFQTSGLATGRGALDEEVLEWKG